MQNVYEKQYKTEIPMKQNVWNPKNWTLFCNIVFLFGLGLMVDYILGIILNNPISGTSYLSKAFSQNYLFYQVFTIIGIILILFLAPLLNEKLDSSPFFTAIAISIILSTMVNQHTLIGTISRIVVSICCAIIIAMFSINITILENEGPISNILALLLGLAMVVINVLLNIVIFGLRVNEVWGIFLIMISFFGIILIELQHIKLGAIPIFIACILNEYVFSFSVSGFNAGIDLLLFVSLFLTAYDFMMD